MRAGRPSSIDKPGRVGDGARHRERAKAVAVLEIRQRMLDAGHRAAGSATSTTTATSCSRVYPECARALDKYCINLASPTNAAANEQFATICKVASITRSRYASASTAFAQSRAGCREDAENTDRDLGKSSEDIIDECMVLGNRVDGAGDRKRLAWKDQIIISARSSRLARSHRRIARWLVDRSAAASRLTEAGKHWGSSGRRRRWACC
jgi:hypothetical protein